MRATAMMMVENYMFDAWNQLLHGVKAGEVPFLKAHGVSALRVSRAAPLGPPGLWRVHDQRLRNGEPGDRSGLQVLRAPDARGRGLVAGGHGSLMATILKANPKLRGVLFDQPSVIARAGKDQHVTAKGIAGRCMLESGNFFESVPKGGDAYIMKYILHDLGR